MADFAIAVVAFIAMEPTTAALHRFVFHGPGWTLHESHHRPLRQRGRWEANDVFPALIAVVTVGLFALGALDAAPRFLVPAAIGITVYGLGYLIVHDGYIHRRLRVRPAKGVWLARLARAHAQHHRTGGPPYGLLWPVARLAPWPSGNGPAVPDTEVSDGNPPGDDRSRPAGQHRVQPVDTVRTVPAVHGGS